MATAAEQELSADDGTRLFVRDLLVQTGPVRGGVMFMHGLGEHCGRYAHLARFFNDRGWSVRLYDQRGHGRSGGARGDVPDDRALLRDAQRVLADFSTGFERAPLLLGHSMGGLFAAAFAAAGMAPLSGLILSSPALGISLSASQKMLLASLGAVSPGLGVPNGLQTRYLSHDPQVVRDYENDTLVHARITPRLLRCMLRTIDAAHSGAPAISVPVLMLVAGDDHMVDAAASASFFARLPAQAATLHRYPHLYHELFNETGADRVYADLAAWMDRNGY